MKKKVVFVCNHLYGGGAEKVLVTLANYFDKCNYEVSIIVFDGKKRYLLNSSIKVVDIGDSNSLFLQAKRIEQTLNNHPDVVISFEYFVNLCTIVACRKMKCKVIVSERNDPARVGAGLLKNRLRNFLYRKCTVLVCQTIDAQNYFPSYIKKHSTVILNPIENNLPVRWEDKRKNEIVTFCRLNSQKNISLLIRSFEEFEKSHPKYKLEIFGDGEDFGKLKKLITSMNLQEKVHLNPARPDIHRRVLQSAMFVSCSNYEGLSNSMLEAMAIGLPTICTDCPCGGARMVIHSGENGLLVPVGSKEALVLAMSKIADNPDFAEKLSKNAEMIRDKLSVEKIASEWEKLF